MINRMINHTKFDQFEQSKNDRKIIILIKNINLEENNKGKKNKNRKLSQNLKKIFLEILSFVKIKKINFSNQRKKIFPNSRVELETFKDSKTLKHNTFQLNYSQHS